MRTVPQPSPAASSAGVPPPDPPPDPTHRDGAGTRSRGRLRYTHVTASSNRTKFLAAPCNSLGLVLFSGNMRGTSDQPGMRGRVHRFSEPIRDWFNRFSSVTQFLLVANIAVFVVQLVFMFLRSPLFDGLFALSGTGLQRGFFWQPVTYMFLHGGILHILINLLVLWFIGREVEFFIGGKYFTRLYFLGGVFGAALWLAFNWQSGIPVVGASAAVLACVIAFATLFPDRQITFLLWFIIPVSIKAKYLALILVALDLVPVLQHAPSNVAHLAHLGGALLGYLYIKQLGYGSTPRWMTWWESLKAGMRPRRRARPARRELSPEEFMREKVDPILDKISREGMQSLTREERATLDAARDLMEKKPR